MKIDKERLKDIGVGVAVASVMAVAAFNVILAVWICIYYAIDLTVGW